MKAMFRNFMRDILERTYGISSHQEWNNFKKNTILFFWRYAMKIQWSASLINEKILKFFNMFPFGSWLCAKYYTLRFFITRKPVAPIIEYVITTHCTMKCKHCNTMIPYFSPKKHAPSIKLSIFKDDIDRLLTGLDYILLFGFVGGEPLMVNDLHEMLQYVLNKEKIHNVFIASNCTILPSKELLQVMKNKKFTIQISDYRDVQGLPVGVVSKYDKFKELLIENNIKFTEPHISAAGERKTNTWITMPNLFCDKLDEDRVSSQFDKCFGREANMLCDGKITQCTVSVYVSRNMDLSSSIQNEIVDIRHCNDIRCAMMQFYCRKYSNFCHYCHFDNMKKGLPNGEQLAMEQIGDI